MHIENIGMSMVKASLALYIRRRSSLSRSSQLYSSHSEQSIINERTQISNHTTRTKHKINKTITKVLVTKQKVLKCKGVDVLEGDRWNVNSRESTDKELSIQKL